MKQFLSDEFEVYSVDCKCGKIAKHEMLGDGNGIMCNPAGASEAAIFQPGLKLN